jgi:transcriptional regulator with XRE-family HTH domain
MTLDELGRQVGVSSPLLSRVERAELKPWPKLRRDVAAVLGAPEDVVWGREE